MVPNRTTHHITSSVYDMPTLVTHLFPMQPFSTVFLLAFLSWCFQGVEKDALGINGLNVDFLVAKII